MARAGCARALLHTCLLLALPVSTSASFPATCPDKSLTSSNTTLGICEQDFSIIGPDLEAVHESVEPPTGLAVDAEENVYLTYPRNAANLTNNVVICTSFTDEEPWPNAEIQRCQLGQNVSECFINVQNVVLDSIGQMWIVDTGIPFGHKEYVSGGAKIMAFDVHSREMLKTYVFPDSILDGGTDLNDLRINNTAGAAGFGFIPDESPEGGLIAINLANGDVIKRLKGTHVVKADANFVGVYNGNPIYCWNGTQRVFCNTASDGIALQSGNVYWGVLASRRFYYVSQKILMDFTASDAAVLAAVQDPGEMGSEQAGFTADDQGRVFMMTSEHNSIEYVQTKQALTTDEVNGVAPGGSGPVEPQNYYVKTLVRSGLIQHADSAAIMNDYLYFCNNQLPLSPGRQYKNVDARKGPFRSYKINIGAGPAV